MKFLLAPVPLLVCAAVLSLTSCEKSTSASPANTGIVGRWQLTNRQCYCPRGPVPNEMVVFTATTFSFSKNLQPAASGTYLVAPIASMCGGSGSVPGLRFTVTSGNLFAQGASYTVSGNTLVLDYGGPCDAPVDTYTRLE